FTVSPRPVPAAPAPRSASRTTRAAPSRKVDDMAQTMDRGGVADVTAPTSIPTAIAEQPAQLPMGWLPDWPDFRVHTAQPPAFLRSMMGAMALFGVPPEKYWPYAVAKFDAEPTAFLYAAAANYRATTYFRLDPPATPATTLLARIKTNIAAGLPSVFGFTVYN